MWIFRRPKCVPEEFNATFQMVAPRIREMSQSGAKGGKPHAIVNGYSIAVICLCSRWFFFSGHVVRANKTRKVFIGAEGKHRFRGAFGNLHGDTANREHDGPLPTIYWRVGGFSEIRIKKPKKGSQVLAREAVKRYSQCLWPFCTIRGFSDRFWVEAVDEVLGKTGLRGCPEREIVGRWAGTTDGRGTAVATRSFSCHRMHNPWK